MPFLGWGGAAKAKREGEEALARAKYDALQKQSERDKDASEKLAQQERDAKNKLEDAFRETAAIEKKAAEDKLKLERDKSDMAKVAAATHLQLVLDSNDKLRTVQQAADEKRYDIEKKAREDQIRLMEENQRKRDNDLAEARERDEKKQMEADAAIKAANKDLMAMKDQTHDKIFQLVNENQKTLNAQQKESLEIMAKKDAANSEKLDKVMAAHQSEVREVHEVAKQREDALHLERKVLDETHRKDLDNMSKMSQQERDKLINDYHTMSKEKDRQLEEIQKAKADKLDELNKNQLRLMKEAHDKYTQLQESAKAEVEKMHRKVEEVLRESSKKQEESANRMLEMTENKNKQVYALMQQLTVAGAVKAQEHVGMIMNKKAEQELAPIEGIKSALAGNIETSCLLWEELDLTEEDLENIKKQLILKAQAMNKNISELLSTIDKCSSLGEQKAQWKKELIALSVKTTDYAMAVRKEIREEETTKKRLGELEKECNEIKTAIWTLSDMRAETLETLVNKSAQGTITYAENADVMKAITAGQTAMRVEEMESSEGPTDEGASIVEP